MTESDVLALVAVGALLAAIGRGLNALVFGSGPKAGRAGWRGVFYVTLWAHPIAAGALLGVPDWLPSPAALGPHPAGRIVWYALAGCFASSAYNAVRGMLKQRSGAAARPSDVEGGGT